jgi:phospholipid/cholesterol/gamma-HCH transport system substrate-binding protein
MQRIGREFLMKRYPMETAVGVFVIAGILCVGYMAVKLGKVVLLDTDTYRLSARFTSVSGLRPGTSVEIYGIQEGSVESLHLDPKRQMAVVTMKINKNVKIYDDATATIKTAGLIGDKYVKIDPGGAGDVIKPGGTIIDTSVPADIEDLIGKYAFGTIEKNPQAQSGAKGTKEGGK